MKKGKDFIGVGVGAVIVNEENEVLLLRRIKAPESGCWTIPGGTVEFGERIEDTLIREIKEELGVDCEIVHLLGVTNHIVPEEKTHWVSPCFLVEINGVPENKEPHSHSDINWFAIEELPQNPTMTAVAALSNYKVYAQDIGLL